MSLWKSSKPLNLLNIERAFAARGRFSPSLEGVHAHSPRDISATRGRVEGPSKIGTAGVFVIHRGLGSASIQKARQPFPCHGLPNRPIAEFGMICMGLLLSALFPPLPREFRHYRTDKNQHLAGCPN